MRFNLINPILAPLLAGAALTLAGCPQPTPDDSDRQRSDTSGDADDTAPDTTGDTSPADTERDTGLNDTGDSSGVPPWLSETTLYINIGDSVAAGYDADSNYGYAWLLYHNRDDWPAYDGHDLNAVASPSILHITDSGATSDEVLDNLRGTSLPSTQGNVVVTISAGGNDFNDSIWTMLSEDLTMSAATEVRENLASMITILRASYGDPWIWLLNVQDPTDGVGTIPSGYDEGFCEKIAEYGALFGDVVIANLGLLNQQIALEADEQGVGLADYHDWFLGHGLNSDDGWMSDDCAHPTSEGHHQMRRLIWQEWTGELY